MGDQTQNFNLSSSVSPPFASTWGTQKIWNAPIGTGMKTATHDSTRPNVKSAPLSRMSFSPDAQRGGDIPSLGDSEAITGSGSLLAESEGWNPGLSSQWGISTTLGSNRAAHTSTSPVRQRTNQHTRSNSPYFTTTPTAIGPGSANKSAFQSHLNPQSQVFSSTRQNSDESERRNLSSISFGSMATNGAPPFSGYNSSAASRSGSLPPSRHGHEQSQQQAQDFTANSLHVSSSEIFTHRPNQHSRNSIYSTNGNTRYGEQGWPFEVTNGFGKMDLGKETQENGFSGYWDQSHQLPSPTSSNGQVNGFRSNSISFDMENRLAQPFISHNVATRGPFNERNTYSPTGSEARRSHDSPMGYSSGAPSITEHSRAMSTASSRNNLNGHPDFLHTKLRDLEHQQAYGQNQQNSLFSYRAPFNFSGQPFDLNMALVNMNHQIPSYYTNPQLARYPQPNRLPPRGPAVDNSNDDSLRSSLLTEFRTCKQTKRYELKVGHIITLT